jgi:hypothetical protein
MRTWPLIYPEALTCPCIASILPERTPPWACLSAFVLSKTLVLATINSPVHSRQNAEKREQEQLRRPSHPRTLALPTPQLRFCPLLQQDKASIAAHTGALFHSTSELHREQHPGTALRAAPQNPHLSERGLHSGGCTTRLAGSCPACPPLDGPNASSRLLSCLPDTCSRPVCRSRPPQPACTRLSCLHVVARLALHTPNHNHAMSLPCAIGTRRAFHHVLRTVSACLRESSS